MKTKQITAYFCDHCNKLYQRKHFLPKHEKSCSKNPDNKRACDSCQYFRMKEYTLCEDNGPYAPSEFKVDLCFCEKKKQFMYPPKVEHKGNAFDLYDEENEPMPRICAYPFIDLAVILRNHKVITSEELTGFKQLAINDPLLGQELFNGFDLRPKPKSFLPF